MSRADSSDEKPLPAPMHILGLVTSTNDLAKEALSRGASHGESFLASGQTMGRGRTGKRWHSPLEQHLYLSLVLKLDWPIVQIAQLTLAAGVTVAQVLRDLHGLEVKLKWPNDVQVGDRKLAGILCEGVIRGEELLGAVVGLGLNLNGDASAFPEPLRPLVTTMEASTGQSLSEAQRVALAAAFVERLVSLVDGPSADSVLSAIRRDWRSWCNLPRRVRLPDGREGDAVAIDEQGRLVVAMGVSTEAVESATLEWLPSA